MTSDETRVVQELVRLVNVLAQQIPQRTAEDEAVDRIYHQLELDCNHSVHNRPQWTRAALVCAYRAGKEAV